MVLVRGYVNNWIIYRLFTFYKMKLNVKKLSSDPVYDPNILYTVCARVKCCC